MAADRGDRLDAATAERILAGVGGGSAPVAELIWAAVASPRPHETAGEDAAVAAFAAVGMVGAGIPPGLTGAQLTTSGRHRPGSRRPHWGRLLTVKALAIGLAVAAGGVALASGTGVLPNPLRPGPAAPGPDGTPSESGHSSPADLRSGTPSAGVLPSASLDGLCHAYLKQLASDHGAAQRSPAFAELFAAAGGVDKAAAYCDARLATPQPEPARSSEHATGPPSPHATGAPAHR